MSTPLLSVITPTIGRSTLRRSILSMAEQAPPDAVEFIVVIDGPGGAVDLPRIDAPVILTDHDAGHRCWGHCPSNHGLTLARGQYVARMDDDDVYAPGAWRVIAAAIAALQEPRPLLFRFRTPGGEVLWDVARELAVGHIGTPCSVFPNDGRLGRYADVYEGDFHFIRNTLARYPAGAVWVDAVIAIARPA